MVKAIGVKMQAKRPAFPMMAVVGDWRLSGQGGIRKESGTFLLLITRALSEGIYRKRIIVMADEIKDNTKEHRK